MGKVFRFNKDVDTDQIIASQYLLYPTVDEMKAHTFESLDANFASTVKPGDYVVADSNFGCGSSREQAPAVSPVSSTETPSISAFPPLSATVSMTR